MWRHFRLTFEEDKCSQKLMKVENFRFQKNISFLSSWDKLIFFLSEAEQK